MSYGVKTDPAWSVPSFRGNFTPIAIFARGAFIGVRLWNSDTGCVGM